MTRKRKSRTHTRESYDSSPSGSEPDVRRRRKIRRNRNESTELRTSESRDRNAPRSSPGSRCRGATRDATRDEGRGASRERHASRMRDVSRDGTRDASRMRGAARATARDASRDRTHASRMQGTARDAAIVVTRDGAHDAPRSRDTSRIRDAPHVGTRDASRDRTRDASRMRGKARHLASVVSPDGAHDASRSRDASRMRDAPQLCDVSPGREVAHGRDTSCSRGMPRRHGSDIPITSPSDNKPAAVVSSFDSIKDADTNTNILVSVFKEFMQTMKADGGSERFPVLNVIPEFDPSKRTQTIETWISKVNECAQIYNWTERQTVHYALPKLAGLAQKWYQGLPSLLFSWAEWQSKLKLAFPSDQNYGQLLTEMLACRADFGESLEEYFYQKVVLLNRCNIHGKNAIDCILFGIEDRSVRTSAEATQFTEPDKLLVYLRNIRITKKFNKPNSSLRAGNADSKQPKILKGAQNDHDNRNNRNYRLTKCYNCGEEGHPYFKCKLPIKRCDKCHQVGHFADSCPGTKESTNNKTVLRISKESDSDSKYFKTAVVNGLNFDCFIDFGSQCSMLQESIAKKLVNSWSVSELPVLRGFGDSVVNCLGKCSVEIKVDSVTATVETLIVPDKLLQIPLLLGQTFTEQEHIVFLKTNNELKITTNTTKNVLVYVDNSLIVHGYTPVSIYTKPSYSGDLFVELSFCQDTRKQYEIIQSVVQVNNGQGIIIIKGLNSGFELLKDTLLLRALPLSQVQTLNIGRIEHCPDNTVTPQIKPCMIQVDDNIGCDHRIKLTELLNEFRDCFAFSVKELGCISGTEMNINLSDTTPVVYRPYRLSHSERHVVREMIKDLTDSGIIKQSSSNYASPIVLVRKKTGDYRLCIDFRALNKKTVKEHYPLPRIDDQLDNLSGHKYFTSLDLASGYYQIPMAESAKHLTAFVTPDGHYEFNRMPFGLVNAPSTFQRAVNGVLGNARFKEAFAYMDDVIIPSRTIEEGLQRLHDILSLFRSFGITLNLSKCNFLKQSIDYLGFEVSNSGVKPGKKKTEAVDQFPRPTDQHKIRQFVGLASFFRKFIRSFSIIAKPLTQLLKKDSKWRWGDAEESAFLKLKTELVKRPILSFYNPEFETQLHTDASKVGVAGILMQRPNKEVSFSAVAFYSRQTSPEEAKFTSYDLETLAVVTSLQRFRVYLLGIHFTIVTDCNSLRATFEKRDILPRVARWWSTIQEFDFQIIYKPGTGMAHVDALSRNPISSEILELQVRRIDTDWVATVQQNDPELQRIIAILNDKENDNVIEIKNNFVVKKGLLYRKTDIGDRWVVPKGVRWQILKSNHDEIGHFGLDKTLEIIKNNYWFAKMRQFTKKYVQSCLECAHSKIPTGKKSGKLHSIEKVEEPFHTVHIDHLGPFVRSKHKNAYLLLIVDAFTKFVIIVPVKSTKSVHSIRAIKNYFHTFSVPKRIISDRGTSFTSKSFQDYLSSLGIKHVMNAVATPRANGQVERYNRTVLTALTATNYDKPENEWDEHISEIQWGLNNTINKGTGKSPAQALFGLNLVSTSNALLQLNVTNDSESLGTSLEDTRKEISEHIKENQNKQKQRFDKARKEVKYKIGELVRVERDVPSVGKSRKLVPKLRGPYRIAEVLDNDRYVIEDTPLSKKGNRRFNGIFSVDKIHPWVVFNRSDSESEVPENDNTD